MMIWILNLIVKPIRLGGLPCKGQNSKKNCKFCCIHYNFDSKITKILNTVFIPDISKICLKKLF